MRRVVLGVGLILGIWFLVYWSGFANPQILPSPLETTRRLFHLLVAGQLNADLLASAKRWSIGFVLGIFCGAPVGLAMGFLPRLREVLDFPVDFFRSLPVTALFPVFLLLFGIEDSSKIAMIAVAVAFIMIVTANYGVRHAPATRQHMADVFGATAFRKFTDVVIPEAFGQIVSGMRVSLGTSLVVMVIAEMFIGGKAGLGIRLYDTYSINAVPDMYAVLLLVGIIGYGLNVAFLFLERRAAFWIGK